MPTAYSSSTTGAPADLSQVPPLDQSLATFMIPGGGSGQPGGGSSVITSQDELLQVLAAHLGIMEPEAGKTTLQQVMEVLSQQTGVRLMLPGSIGTQQIRRWAGGSPGRAGGRGGTVSKTEPTSTPPSADPKALAEIAKRLGAKGNDLAAIAAHFGIQSNLSAQSSSQGSLGGTISGTWATQLAGKTAAQAYVQLTKDLADPKQKATIVNDLSSSGFLDPAATGGSPTNNQIGSAFQRLLTTSATNKTDLNTTMVNQIQLNTTGANGQPVIGNTSETSAYITGMAEKFGIHLTDGEINTINTTVKTDATTNGPGSVADEIKNLIVQYFNPNDPLNPPGAANDMFIKIQQTAIKYGIPYNPDQIKSMVVQGIRNSSGDTYSIAQATTDIVSAAEQHFQAQAVGLYPTLASQITAGMAVPDLIAPYNNITAQYTGKDPATLSNPGVDPTSPNYKFLQGARDPKTGAPTMMTMDAWKKTLMTDQTYGFQNTTGAHNMASQFTSALLNAFGKVKTEGTPGGFSGYSNNPGSANT